jgi:hypothetical protein
VDALARDALELEAPDGALETSAIRSWSINAAIMGATQESTA